MGHDNNGSGIGFGLGLAAGLVLGSAWVCLLAPKEGAALRRDLADRARRLKEDAEGFGRDMGRSARSMAEQGASLPSRVRTAASEGLARGPAAHGTCGRVRLRSRHFEGQDYRLRGWQRGNIGQFGSACVAGSLLIRG